MDHLCVTFYPCDSLVNLLEGTNKCLASTNPRAKNVTRAPEACGGISLLYPIYTMSHQCVWKCLNWLFSLLCFFKNSIKLSLCQNMEFGWLESVLLGCSHTCLCPEQTFSYILWGDGYVSAFTIKKKKSRDQAWIKFPWIQVTTWNPWELSS